MLALSGCGQPESGRAAVRRKVRQTDNFRSRGDCSKLAKRRENGKRTVPESRIHVSINQLNDQSAEVMVVGWWLHGPQPTLRIARKVNR